MATASNNANSEQHVRRGGQQMTKLLLTAEEVAEVLGIGRTKVYELMASGRLRSVQIGRLRRVAAPALEDFVATLESESA